MTLTWSIEIDWDGDGSWAHDEAARAVSVLVERGREDEFGEWKAGKAVVTLDNLDRRYDPWYTASPLYPNVLPRRGIRISVGEPAATDGQPVGLLLALTQGSIHRIFTGKIEDPRPIGGPVNRQMRITAYDGWRDLVANEGSIALQEDVDTGTAIGRVLDDVGWADRALDAGNDTMAYWWSPKKSSAQAIRDLVASEHGMFIIDKQGRARFVNRSNLLMASNAGEIEQAQLADIELNLPWDSVRNLIEITANPVTLADTAVLWKLEDTALQVQAGETITLWAQFMDAYNQACPAKDVIAPEAGTDYAADTLEGGGGVDMTAHMSVSASIMGMSAKLDIHNAHPTDSFFITLLRIRGKAITVRPTTVVRESPTSQAQYGKRKLALDLPWQQSVATAADLASSLRAFYSDAHKSATIRLDMQVPAMLQHELGDRIGLSVPDYDIADSLVLGSIRLETQGSMQALAAEWHLEAADNAAYWLLGVAGSSELGSTTRLGY